MKVITLILYFICIPKIFSQIVNDGTLKIGPSTIVSFQDAYTNTLTGTHDNEGQLYLNSNFINNGATSVTTIGTTYFNSSVNAIQTISGTTGYVDFYNLEIANTSTGVSVVDNFGLIVKNAVHLSSGTLRLVGEAQLVQKHTGLDANTSGSGKLLRDLQGISSTYGYNYWSASVHNSGSAFSLNGGLFDGTDTAINPFTPQQILFNTGSPYNGIPATVSAGHVTTALTINDEWLYTYSPNTSGYGGWERITQNTLINPGFGFTMKGTGILAVSQNYVFRGAPNNGDYTFNIESGESALIGNPYPSSLDSFKFIDDNSSIINQIEFWVDGGSSTHYSCDYLGGYAIQNITGSVPPSIIPSISGLGSAVGINPKRYIAVGQGFFVTANSSGNITFNNSQRLFHTEDGIGSNFHKTSLTKNNDTAKINTVNSFIRIGYQDPEMFHRQLLLGFLRDSSADLSFNQGYDAFMADPREDELFFTIDNDPIKKYVIQGVDAYNNLYEFPLGLIITQAGNHTIMLDAVENFTDPVYIKDMLLNVTYNLSEANFNPILPPGDYTDRFKIVFQPTGTLSADALIQNEINVYYKNNNLIINNKNKIELNNILVFDMLGQKIIEVEKHVLDATQITLPFTNSHGMYLVHINTVQGQKTYKIIK